MRIGVLLLTGMIVLLGGVLSVTWIAEPDVTTLSPVSVRVASVPPKRDAPTGGGAVYIGGSSSSSRGRYSSGGGFSSGK